MRALAIVHQPDAGPGVFADAVLAHGWTLDEWPIAAGGAPPADPVGYDAVLAFGGAAHPDQGETLPWMSAERAVLAELLSAHRPVMGVCLGAQLLAQAAGGAAERAARPEIGWHEVTVEDEGRADPLLSPLAPSFTAFGWHSYACRLPPGAVVLARSTVCVQAYRLGSRAWGIQFHAEVAAGDVERWTRDYGTDPDAVRTRLDPDRLRARTADELPAWNRLGAALCRRFLTEAGRHAR